MLNKNKLRSAIAEAGYTQGRLAEAIGISKNTMSSKVNGKSCFDVNQVDMICRVLGIIDPNRKADIFLFEESQFRDNKAVS